MKRILSVVLLTLVLSLTIGATLVSAGGRTVSPMSCGPVPADPLGCRE